MEFLQWLVSLHIQSRHCTLVHIYWVYLFNRVVNRNHNKKKEKVINLRALNLLTTLTLPHWHINIIYMFHIFISLPYLPFSAGTVFSRCRDSNSLVFQVARSGFARSSNHIC